MNDLDAYQKEAVQRKNNQLNDLMALAIWGLGLAGEAGEVAELIKKVAGHGHPLDREKMQLEIGDVLWYIAVLSDQLGFKLSEIADANTAKLKARYGDSFSVKASMERV